MAGNQEELRLRRTDVIIAYTFLRVVFGVNFFNHGLTRIADIPGFAESMVQLYQDMFIPAVLVRIPAYLIPPVELVVGGLLIVGLATRKALMGGFTLMVVLMAGVTLLQNWDAAASQLIYCLVYFLLLAGSGLDAISLDRFFQKKREKRD